MALTTFTAQEGTGGIYEVALAWTGLASDKSLTIYRTTSSVSTPSSETDWSSATVVGTGVTGEGMTDYPGSAGTYYYYATDGTTGETYDAANVTLANDYAEEIQPDYIPTAIDKVTMADAYRNALNNGGRVTFNPIKLPFDDADVGAKNKVAVVVILGAATELTEAALGETLAGKCRSFAILQSGEIYGSSTIGSGYEAKLTGSTQVQYVKS